MNWLNCWNRKIISIGITYKHYIKILKYKSLYGAFLIYTKLQKQMENIMLKGLIAKHFIKIFSFYGNLIRECFEKNFWWCGNFAKNSFQKANKYIEAEMPIYFLTFNDERQGGVESNDKIWLWNSNVTL